MTFEDMQRGELDWWRAYLKRPNALPRLFALYGFRYLDFFFEEFNDLGDVIDFGSGPVSAAYIADKQPDSVTCVDPLFDAYQDAGLVYGTPFTPGQWSGLSVFDTALILNVLDHADDPLSVLRAAWSSLAVGGKALVWVHVENPADSLHRTVTGADVRGWLEEAGFVIHRIDVRRGLGPAQFMAVAERA